MTERRRPSRANAQFFIEAVEQKAKSKQAGRPIFDDVEMVRISVPGSKLTTVVNRVTDDHRSRFAQEYAAFKQGVEDQCGMVGTPLSEWPMMNPSKIRELNFFEVFTVDQVAALTDEALSHIGSGSRELRDQARAYLERADDSAINTQLAAQNQELREEVERLTGTVAELAAKIEELAPGLVPTNDAAPVPEPETQKRRPGRPKGSSKKAA